VSESAALGYPKTYGEKSGLVHEEYFNEKNPRNRLDPMAAHCQVCFAAKDWK